MAPAQNLADRNAMRSNRSGTSEAAPAFQSAKVNQLLTELTYQERLLRDSTAATCLREGERGRTQRRDMIQRLKAQLANAGFAQ